ncbi:hypothetical protein OUZ56_016680 [Daphnia magna]|uniref:Uncharacterized protein n=1 Tax=Daphnia magna TaxID=35525 RepID=A0ABR0AR86_9CRUS|nr:hypothetical protein OUZ56_016680 [Daphnia magna]
MDLLDTMIHVGLTLLHKREKRTQESFFLYTPLGLFAGESEMVTGSLHMQIEVSPFFVECTTWKG